MSIAYSLVGRLTNPSDKNSEVRVYPVAQMKKQVFLRDIAEHLADHGSPYSVGTILGLLTDAVHCMVENLKEGNRVDMEDLGDFFVSLSSDGAESSAKFRESMIKKINLRWQNSERMEKAMQGVGLEFVPALNDLADAKRKTKERADLAAGVEPGEDAGGGDPDLTD